jgi:WD40 repeat protein
VRSAAYGPGGWFATGSADRTVKLWDAAGRPVLTLRTGGGVRKVAVSTDGQLLTVLVDGERAVRRWRLDHLRNELTALGLELGLP